MLGRLRFAYETPYGRVKADAPGEGVGRGALEQGAKCLRRDCRDNAEKGHRLNTKDDGLEDRVLVAMDETGVTQFFFLDTVLPTLVKWVV